MNERAIKLLEVATHPTTPDGERKNAIAMFRGMMDKEGGLRKALNVAPANKADADSFWLDAFRREEAKRKEHFDAWMLQRKEIVRLTDERNAILQRYTSLRNAITGITSEADDLNDPFRALYGALTSDWRTIGQLVDEAVKNGFKGADNTLRKRADNLAARGVIEVREETWTDGGFTHQPRAWRHKP